MGRATSVVRAATLALLLASTGALLVKGPPSEREPAAPRPPGAALTPPPAGDTAAATARASPEPLPAGPAVPPPPPATAPPPQPPPPSASSKGTAVSRCARYDRGGSVHPLCTGASGTGSVAVERIPSTNVVVNRAWVPNVTAFFAAARAAGFRLQAYDLAGPGYGSFRTAAMQQELRRRGFPANPPGESMHEWGLAIDLSCNGARFLDAPASCRNWVRANAGRYGISNLPSEPWHWSSNGQ